MSPRPASRRISPPFPAAPNSEYEEEFNPDVEMLLLVALRAIAPPCPAFPESELEFEFNPDVEMLPLVALRAIAPPLLAPSVVFSLGW
ncbi:MAG: hypothetical protein ACYTXT_09970 [Nostoc sp.]